ncbi:hypothetical protein ETAR_13280 [Edwardsiella tarda]
MPAGSTATGVGNAHHGGFLAADVGAGLVAAVSLAAMGRSLAAVLPGRLRRMAQARLASVSASGSGRKAVDARGRSMGPRMRWRLVRYLQIETIGLLLMASRLRTAL